MFIFPRFLFSATISEHKAWTRTVWWSVRLKMFRIFFRLFVVSQQYIGSLSITFTQFHQEVYIVPDH